MSKRIEIFTDGSAESEAVVKQVRKLACPKCTVHVHNINGECEMRVKKYGIQSVPAVVMDGKLINLKALKRG
ncbi:thioredoxin family protein [Paenibacillus harenae]|uniref:thioredoxin family protein n=1 Tax=Paenibacillus harenae TaxID=306543 RepID=UPI0004205B33|nr:thioredoxin family protein [Paenibacillus harenae]